MKLCSVSSFAAASALISVSAADAAVASAKMLLLWLPFLFSAAAAAERSNSGGVNRFLFPSASSVVLADCWLARWSGSSSSSVFSRI